MNSYQCMLIKLCYSSHLLPSQFMKYGIFSRHNLNPQRCVERAHNQLCLLKLNFLLLFYSDTRTGIIFRTPILQPPHCCCTSHYFLKRLFFNAKGISKDHFSKGKTSGNCDFHDNVLTTDSSQPKSCIQKLTDEFCKHISFYPLLVENKAYLVKISHKFQTISN